MTYQLSVDGLRATIVKVDDRDPVMYVTTPDPEGFDPHIVSVPLSKDVRSWLLNTLETVGRL